VTGQDERAAMHSLVDRLYNASVPPGDRIAAGAKLRAHLKHVMDGIDRRALEEIREDIALRVKRLPKGGGIA
jgi:hypothetical protein